MKKNRVLSTTHMPCHEHSRGSLGARPSHAGRFALLFSVLYRACANTTTAASAATAASNVPSPVCRAGSFRRWVRVLARRRTRADHLDRASLDGPRVLARLPFRVPPPCVVTKTCVVSSHMVNRSVRPSQSARRKGQAWAKIEGKEKGTTTKAWALECERENRRRHCVVERRAGPRCCAARSAAGFRFARV
jgi:hypothetical protein